MSDFHPAIAEGVAALALDGRLPQLEHAARFSSELIETARSELTTAVPPKAIPVDVVALGSVARREASDTSDFDYLVVAHQLVSPADVGRTRELLAAVADFMKKARLGNPGETGMFGQVVSAPEFIERIGLQQDTNVTHTHRMLLLEESVSVYRPELQSQLLEAVITRYLADYEKPKKGVPRFLLNDVERYWRTLCVDYQAKRWSQTQQGWGLRYLKLIVSRKLAFVGTITSLLLCDEATTPYFMTQFEMPPLARFVQLHKRLSDKAERESLRQALVIAEEFAVALADQSFRDEAKQISGRQDIKPKSRFSDMQDRARKLQEHLEVIFFGKELGAVSKRYLSF